MPYEHPKWIWNSHRRIWETYRLGDWEIDDLRQDARASLARVEKAFAMLKARKAMVRAIKAQGAN
jgi:hypothetical protein